jgi:hypothetical protein
MYLGSWTLWTPSRFGVCDNDTISQANVVAKKLFREIISPHITYNELMKTTSPHMCALEDLEIDKRIFLYSLVFVSKSLKFEFLIGQ